MNRRSHWFAWTVGVLMLTIGPVCLVGVSLGMTPSDVMPGVFAEATPSRTLPDGWRTYSLAAGYSKTKYTLVSTERGPVVRARSESSSSALATTRRIDLTAYPVLEWRWKVDGIVEEGKIGVRSRDDFPARVVVSFDYGDLSLLHRLRIVTYRVLGYDVVPRRALIYVWANRMDSPRVAPWPYGSWMREVAVERGTTRVGTWVAERRNVLADYRQLFGEEPPPVARVGVMTDTDNTNSAATAYYTDVRFLAAPDSTAADSTRQDRLVLLGEKETELPE